MTHDGCKSRLVAGDKCASACSEPRHANNKSAQSQVGPEGKKVTFRHGVKSSYCLQARLAYMLFLLAWQGSLQQKHLCSCLPVALRWARQRVARFQPAAAVFAKSLPCCNCLCVGINVYSWPTVTALPKKNQGLTKIAPNPC